MKKLIVAGLLGFGALVATAAPASASVWSGLHYSSEYACNVAALGAQASGHTGVFCTRDPQGYYLLWWD
ncbi:hypothetical protein ACFWY9_04410 [Amycolatopsis sp. NPDC059027]|uniref:hypothetical protein n=1 Tax=Amycolatopsis sp. NPDC059027 TaxID=3346709 RepID=UPI00366C06BA